jgi:hypothetical protein
MVALFTALQPSPVAPRYPALPSDVITFLSSLNVCLVPGTSRQVDPGRGMREAEFTLAVFL